MPSPANGGRAPSPEQRRHDAPLPPFGTPRAGAKLRNSLPSIRDTFSSRHHSLPISYSHAHYLRTRVLAVGMIFLLLTPLWALVDAAMLPAELLGTTLAGRAALMIGLLGVLVLAKFSREKIGRIRLSAGMLLALPSALYALVLLLLRNGQTA